MQCTNQKRKQLNTDRVGVAMVRKRPAACVKQEPVLPRAKKRGKGEEPEKAKTPDKAEEPEKARNNETKEKPEMASGDEKLQAVAPAEEKKEA